MTTEEMIIRGRTVEDALLIAKTTFEVDENQLEVEVLDEGQQGFLGFLERPAVIRVAVLQPDRSQMPKDQNTEPDCDGTVEVRHGKLYVRDPVGNGKPATVAPTSGAILFVNQVIALDSTPVWENDEIEIELMEEVYPAQVEVEISDDFLTAYVKVTPQITIRNELMDQAAQNTLQLVTQGKEEKVKTITPTQIEEALQAEGVIFGLDHDAIEKAPSEADGTPVAVARGKSVQQGKDGFVEHLFDMDPVEVVYDEDERVDHWERYVFPSVNEGDVIATLHPPVPGVYGMKVTGEAIPPDPVREAALHATDGVRISDDGRKAIADIAGRPLMEGRGIKHLKVTQLMTHFGDVDITSGNLRFSGDLLILGNVTEGMQVSVLGDVTVKGNVTGAVIRAGNRVVCQGSIIKSQIYAGNLTKLRDLVAPLVDDLGKLILNTIQETANLQQLLISRGRLESQSATSQEKNTVGQIVRLLIQKKSESIKAIIKQCTAALDLTDLPLPPPVNELVQTALNLIRDVDNTGGAPLETLEIILDKTREVSRLLDSLPDRPNDIVCSYVQNSVLEAADSISVIDKGGFYSTLDAGKDVSVQGVFRGGEISAKGNVFVHEAGSPGLSSGDVRIKVRGASTVKVRKAFPEITIQVGNRSHVVKNEQNVLKLQLDENGDISLGAFST
ncbi:MAG: DUF342 domain-containing protein [Firmicutes bacterium]|nr:DUF342 domain-containing protein [Bacillota bacterium]